MKNTLVKTGMFLVLFLIIQMGCSMPGKVWPQKDIELFQVNDPSTKTRVLVASRESGFKSALVKRIRGYYEGRPVYVKCTGIDALSRENAGDYSCIVLVSTCIARGLDPEVLNYIEANPYYYEFIVLTTSGNGAWMPEIKHEEVDTVSSASVMADVDEKALEAVTLIDEHLKENLRLVQ